jgi:radical SAM superfamily enzyme YgiQ (UPF0313 family)
MKIAFVRPNMGRVADRPYRSRAMMEPLVFAVLSGLTPARHARRFYDERVDAVPLDAPVDLVAISVETHAARRAYELADAFRARGVPVVLGGFHPTLCPDEAAAHADAVACGEVEGLWETILRDAEAGTLQPVYRRTERPPLDGLPVDRSIFHGKGYLPLALLQYARGCPHACDFCAIHRFYGPQMRHRPLDDVLREIDGLSTRTLFFVDDNLTGDPAAARALFTALKARHVRWISQTELGVARDPALLDLMADSGCLGLIIGLESLNADTLALMNKRWASHAGDYAGALAAIKARGILVYGAFLFGYDYDTPDDIARTLDFALAQQLFLATFNVLQPYPGTPLYARLQAEGRLLFPRWWLDPAYRWELPAFRPARMTPEALAEACTRARTRFSSTASLLRRGWDFHAHLRDPRRALFYLLGNLLSRHDIAQKQGLALGGAAEGRA